jgi:hypothetical protein
VLLDDVEVNLVHLLGCALLVLMRGAPKARSAGRTASDPYTRKKGEYPVAELTWVQRPHIT